MVLERLEHARSRGAKIYAEIAGAGFTADAYHITAMSPGGEGAARAMSLAMQDAGVAPQEVQYINAHGTSTPMNDLCETNALKAVFGERVRDLAVSSTKSQMGHLISAAGAVEGALCVLAIRDAKVPMTANLELPDPQCDLDYVTEGPRPMEVGVALSNSFGFGGHNVSICFQAVN